MKIYIGFTEEQLKEVKYQDKLATMKEKWKWINIDGVRTPYKISNFGRIKNTLTGKINDFKSSKSRYYSTKIIAYDKYGKKIQYSTTVHRLVAMYFCKIPKRHLENGLGFNDLVPNHKDGNKHHNASFNLEWVTNKENSNHAWKEGLCESFRGEKCHLAKMTEKDAIEICELIMQRKTNKEIMEITGRSKKQIQHIRNKECWKAITKNYDFPKLGTTIPYKVSDSEVIEICKRIRDGIKDSKISEEFNCSREYIRDIRLKKRRRNISKYYF